MYANTTGDGNVAIGQNAGQRNTTGSNNVFLGKDAGNNANHESLSDRLVISNSNTTTPLIDGDFNAATLNVNGALTANSFVGDGSGLTGISSIGSLTDLGLTATTTELNYVEGVTSNIQNQIDSKISITEDQASAIEANTAKVGYTDAVSYTHLTLPTILPV